MPAPSRLSSAEVAAGAGDAAEVAAAGHRRAPSPRTFLSFDYGQRRVGVAVGNTVLAQAQALQTVAAEGDARLVALAALIAQWQPDALVVGVPFHPDGAAHEMTHQARRFARQLRGRFGLPVHEVDERYTTTEALAQGARGAAAGVDAVAAALILDQFFRNLPPGAADAAA